MPRGSAAMGSCTVLRFRPQGMLHAGRGDREGAATAGCTARALVVRDLASVAMQVLVIDDSPADVQIISRILRRAYPRCEIVPAISGQEGLTLLKEGAPDVVLLDYFMTDVTGPDVLEHVRRDPSTRSTPVVIVTGLADDFERLHRLPANGIVHKSADYARFREAIVGAVAPWLGPPQDGEQRRAAGA